MKKTLTRLSDWLLFRKRAIMKTINNELKNIAHVEHSKHRPFNNFIVNTFGKPAAYCCFPKKPSTAIEKTWDKQSSLF